MAAAAESALRSKRKTVKAEDVTECVGPLDSALLFSSELPAPLPTPPKPRLSKSETADAATKGASAGSAAGENGGSAADDLTNGGGFFIDTVGDGTAAPQSKHGHKLPPSSVPPSSVQEAGGNILVKSNVVPNGPFKRDMAKLLKSLEPRPGPGVSASAVKRFPDRIDSAALFFLRKAVCRDLYRFFHAVATGSTPPPVAALVVQQQLSPPSGGTAPGSPDGDGGAETAGRMCKARKVGVA